jgi:opacity protein-like surface antigen
MRVRFLCGLLASIAAGAGSAVAADMPVRPPAVAPAVAPCCAVPDWAGFYVGIHGGEGWGHETFDASKSVVFFDYPIPFTVPPNETPKGGVFGFQFGHNWQWGPVVGGLEVDFSGADMHSSTVFFGPFDPPKKMAPETTTFTQDKKIDALASARGRLGYLIFPNWLLYGTAGIGWGHERISETAVFAPAATSVSESTFVNQFGWVAGVGLEWKFFSNNWLLRAEWLHYDFGRITNPYNSFTLNSFPFFLDNGNVRNTVDVARAALSYKF